MTDWRCECGDLNRDHEAFCFRCGAGRPDDPSPFTRIECRLLEGGTWVVSGYRGDSVIPDEVVKVTRPENGVEMLFDESLAHEPSGATP